MERAELWEEPGLWFLREGTGKAGSGEVEDGPVLEHFCGLWGIDSHGCLEPGSGVIRAGGL